MKARLNGYEMRLAVESSAHKICSELGRPPVRITWADGVQTAAINAQGEMFLSNIKDDTIVPRPLFDRYVGFVLHELLHHNYTTYGITSDNQYVRQLHNAVEDAWIEHKCIDENLVGNANALLSGLIDGMVTEAIANVSDWSDPRQYPFVLAVYLRKHASIKVPLATGLEPIFAEASKRIAKVTSSADTLTIAEWVYSQLNNLPQQSQQQSQQQKSSDKGNQQSGEKGSEKGEKGSTSPDQGSGEGEGAADQKNAGNATSPCDPNGNLKSPAVCVEPQIKSPDYTDGWGATYSKTHNMTRSHLWGDAYHGFVELPVVGGRLKYNVKKLFENTGTTEYQPNRKAGAINTRALHTIPSGNDRVFKRRLDIEGIDSSVVIVLDASGSMFPTKLEPSKRPMNSAIATCRALLEALDAAQVATALVVFGSETSVLKDFNAPVKRVVKSMNRLGPAGGTNDYFAVRLAHEMLLGRTERRKVCFVITDGRGDVVSTTDQVKSARNLGITTIGIGIQSDISDIYPNSVRVDDVKDLGKVAFEKMKMAV